MSVVIKPSKPFSNGMSYEFFLENFCYRCKHGKIRDDGFPEFPENGGCKTWDALEVARFNTNLYPSGDIVQIERNGRVEYWNICKNFETDDAELMERYKALFDDSEQEG